MDYKDLLTKLFKHTYELAINSGREVLVVEDNKLWAVSLSNKRYIKDVEPSVKVTKSKWRLK